jgi:hypothetical protein
MNYFASYRLLLHTVKTFPFVLCTAFLLCCAPLVQAQDDEVVVDSAVVEAPAVEFGDDNGALKLGTMQQQEPEFRKVPDSAIQSLKSRKEFSYANDPKAWERDPEPQVETKSNSKGFWHYFYQFFSVKTIRRFTYGILIAFFVFVIYRIIVVNKLFLFHTFRKAKLAAETEDAGDITATNLDEKIRQMISANDHRMAVRYMYLKALQLLSEKQWIRYHADGTNYEYVNQMNGRKLANEFGFLTRVYDYVWYGEFAITGEQFDTVHKNFSHFYNALHS